MKRVALPLLLSLLMLAPLPVAAGTRIAPVADFPARIRAALESGAIDRETAARYWEQAVRQPELLPPEFSVQISPESGGAAKQGAAPALVVRCGTPHLPRPLVPERTAARDAARTALRVVLVGGKVGTVDLPNWIATEHFTIEWGSELTNENGFFPVLDVGPLFDGDPVVGGNGIPDVAERWAAYFEAAFREEVTERRFTHPAFDKFLFPIVLGNSDPNQSIDDIGPFVYGFTQPFFDPELPDDPDLQGLSYIVVNNDFTFLETFGIQNEESTVYPDDPLALLHGGMKVTAGHEFFHMIQFLYDPDFSVFFEGDWWTESTATWMEDEAFDYIDDYYQYFSGGIDREGGGAPAGEGWADRIEDGLAIDVVTASPNQIYGGVVFPKYLQQHVKRDQVGGEEGLLDIWTRLRAGGSLLPTLDAFAVDAGFAGGLSELYLGFGGANAALDQEYEEGANFGAVPIRKDSLTADSTVDTIPGSDPPELIPVPQYLGSTYLGDPTPTAPVGFAFDDVFPVTDWGLSVRLQRTAPVRGLVFGTLTPAGTGSLALPGTAADGELTGAVSFLDSLFQDDPGDDPLYRTLTTPAVLENVPPETVPFLIASGVPGGLNAVWDDAADDTGVAGYVVQVFTPLDEPVLARGLFGPMTEVEIRELDTGTYRVQVHAYDATGNEGPALSVSGVQVVAAEPTPVPLVPIFDQESGVPQELPGSRGIGGPEGIGTDYGLDKICFIGLLGI
jgi:hypothetical protein